MRSLKHNVDLRVEKKNYAKGTEKVLCFNRRYERATRSEESPCSNKDNHLILSIMSQVHSTCLSLTPRFQDPGRCRHNGITASQSIALVAAPWTMPNLLSPSHQSSCEALHPHPSLSASMLSILKNFKRLLSCSKNKFDIPRLAGHTDVRRVTPKVLHPPRMLTHSDVYWTLFLGGCRTFGANLRTD